MNILHVNQGNIRSNIHRQPKDRLPVLRAQGDHDTLYGDRIDMLGEDGEVLASIVYRPDNPLPCGARVWIETELDVAVGDTEDAGHVVDGEDLEIYERWKT